MDEDFRAAVADASQGMRDRWNAGEGITGLTQDEWDRIRGVLADMAENGNRQAEIELDTYGETQPKWIEPRTLEAMAYRMGMEDSRKVVYGNPGNIPLHEALASAAQFVAYEAAVVTAAADELDDQDAPADMVDAAQEQAEAMEDAADALQEAAEAAADTAAELFVETGTPSDEQDAPVVAGNPVDPRTIPDSEWKFENEDKYSSWYRSGGFVKRVDKPGNPLGETVAYYAVLEGNPVDDHGTAPEVVDAVVDGNPIPVVEDVAGIVEDTESIAPVPDGFPSETADVPPEPHWWYRPRFGKGGR